MNATSQAIKALIDNTPGYDLDMLLADLGATPGDTEEFLTPKEICKLLKICHTTFFERKRKGFFTPYRVGGGFPKYKKSEVIAAMKGDTSTSR